MHASFFIYPRPFWLKAKTGRTSPLESQPLPPTLVAGLGFGDGAGALGRGHDAHVTGGGSIEGRSRLRSSIELTAGDLCSCVRLVVFVLFLFVSVGSCYGGFHFNGTDDRRTKHAAKEQEEADRVNGGGVNGGGGRRDRTTKRPSQREKVVDEEEEEEEWTDDEVDEEEWGFEDEGWIDVLAR